VSGTYRSFSALLRSQDTCDVLLRTLCHAAARLRSGQAPAILTHFERAEYFLLSLHTPAYEALAERWTRRTGVMAQLRRKFENEMVVRLASLSDGFDGAGTPLRLDLDGFTYSLAPGCGVLPNEMYLAIEKPVVGTTESGAPRELGPGLYLAYLDDVRVAYGNIPNATSRLRLKAPGAARFEGSLGQATLLDACRLGQVFVPCISCAGVPTHLFVDETLKADDFDGLDFAQSAEVPIRPREDVLDRLDRRFVARFDRPRHEHFLWLSWIYHPRHGTVPDFARNRLIRQLLPLVA